MTLEIPKLHAESYAKGVEELGVESGEGGRQGLSLCQLSTHERGMHAIQKMMEMVQDLVKESGAIDMMSMHKKWSSVVIWCILTFSNSWVS